MKSWSVTVFLLLLLAGSSLNVYANPTQCGETGLLTQPSAETLNAGNICIGVWGNYASGSDGTGVTIVPVTITMGLGTFMEAYGSYPNLLFNDDEQNSGRGFADVGFKFRVLGKRSSPFKIALDGQIQRAIADDPVIDGLTDYQGRVIASYKPGKFGFHLNAGYLSNDSPEGDSYDDQVLFGGGLEFLPVYRLRLIAEMESKSEKIKGIEGPAEATVGLQYFLAPHLTLNFGVGIGLSDSSPDWRALVGLTGCQGVGNYINPIDRVIEPVKEEPGAEPSDSTKKIKLQTLTPLIPMQAVKTSPVAKLEIPVESPAEEVIVTPEEKLSVSSTAGLDSLAVAPVESTDPVVVTNTPEKPIRAIVYRKFRLPEFTFEFDQHTLSAEGEKVLSQIAEELRKERKWLIVRIDGHTDSVGPDRYNEELSLKRSIAAATHLVLRDGIAPTRLFVKGFGESKPIAANESPEGRSENRRLELLILSPQEVAE
ncbi:OmpA family protein [Trichloromonas sp.]|uniref:OmpA family protein n=1 Tax=Trichloromonas sp. TaxID=3069249 RepID=UPI003D8191DE